MKTPPSGAGGINIVKIGGNVIENEQELDAFLTLFAQLPEPKILVHGGGKLASEMAKKLDIPIKMTQGRRITDVETLDVITMVYGGKVNKNIVAKLQAKKCNAIGLSGADGNTILSVKRPVKDVDFGFVGDVVAVNTEVITSLLSAGLTPVFCAITHDKNGQLLNTNADTIACEIARSLTENHEVTLFYCFEKAGVLKNVSDENSVIKEINLEEYRKLVENGTVSEGMLPKLQNCFYALEGGVHRVQLGKPAMLNPNETEFTSLSL
ncbi:acetylglutamate kinase [Leeuwenhoekiella sp. MAR_2009_132]|uniref:acetylglutamate kinase n=1 Tax=Flavimarina sp. Hel_I_48 TaxID=1392488 RepID=UPI0004DED572